MTTPEIPKEIQRPPEQVQVIPEQVDVHQSLVEAGVTPQPTQPPSLTQSGQVVAQSVGTIAPTTQPIQTIQVPADQNQAIQWSGGSVNDSSTWLGLFILRRLKQAIQNGWRIVIGTQK